MVEVKTVIHTLDQLFLGNSLKQWAWALAIGMAVMLVTWVIRRVVRANYARMASTERMEFMEVPLQIASRTTGTFLLILSAFFAAVTLTLPSLAQHVAEKILLIACCWQVGIWASTGALAWIDHKRRFKLSQDRATAGTLGVIAIMVRVLIWAVVLLLTLDNLGINVTTLVAGLGIGGVAVALAVQNVLGDLLASLSITLDKPFVIGDALGVDDINGSVEQIGWKSTRLRSVNGEQIIMPNADLLKSRVRNYGRMQERRSVFTLAVTYETARDQLQRIPAAVRGFIAAQDKVRFERCHLARFAPTAIEFEAVYVVLTADYNVYMDTQQAVYLQIIDYFEREHIEFAYSSQKLLLMNQAPPSPQNSPLATT